MLFSANYKRYGTLTITLQLLALVEVQLQNKYFRNCQESMFTDFDPEILLNL